MPGQAIRTERLSKTFRGKSAVRQVSLSVAPGSVYAFLGPNGAGKSTTIRMLLGLLRPTEGSVALHGMDLQRHRLQILARTGSLIENPSLYAHLTGRENLEICRRVLGAPASDIDRALDIVGLQNAGGSCVKTYSLGMKQRLGLAQALIGRRDLLVLDEPTNGLDPAGMLEVRSLIREVPARHGITVFLSTHLLTEAEQIATHVGILSRGELVFQGTATELSLRRQPRLRIRTDRISDAGALLASAGWPVTPAGESILAEDVTAAAAITRVLVEAGHAVHHVAVETASFEEIFLSMTDAEVL